VQIRLTRTAGDNAVAAGLFFDPRPPAAPSQLSATAPSSTQVRLTWTDTASNETGFHIERSLNGTTFQQVASVGGNVTTYTDPNRTAGTLYYYRVRAYNTGGTSAYSSVVSIRTP
jgi:hypothetical protein